MERKLAHATRPTAPVLSEARHTAVRLTDKRKILDLALPAEEGSMRRARQILLLCEDVCARSPPGRARLSPLAAV
jgi:hypothetical protein